MPEPAVLSRVWTGIQRDVGAWRAHLAPPAPPRPGLYTYRGAARLHLRVEADRAAVFFADVTDVVHLNPTAAYIVHQALEGRTPEQAAAALQARFAGLSRAQAAAEVSPLFAMVDRFRRPERGCPTCALAELPRAPGRPAAPFSTPIHAPFKADLALTYGCNNACSHCYNEPGRLGMASLTGPEWRQVIDRLHAVGVPHLIFTGGEASLHPDLLDLIAYADGRGQVCGLNTNGRRLAHAPFARALAGAGLSHVQITLASHRAEVHDAINGAAAFRQTVRGIENALAAGLHTITNTTLLRANAGEIEPLLDFLHQLGLRTFALNGLIHSGGGFAGQALTEAELAPLLVRVRDRAAALGMEFLWYTPTEYCRLSPVELEIGAKRCNAGEYSLCIEPNGDVLPCQSFYVSAGNLLRDPWDQIWNSALFHSFRGRGQDPRWAGLPEKCWACPDLPLCGGGCRIEREARAGVRTAAGGCASCAPAPAGFTPGAALIHADRRASGDAPLIPVDDLLAAWPDGRAGR